MYVKEYVRHTDIVFHNILQKQQQTLAFSKGGNSLNRRPAEDARKI